MMKRFCLYILVCFLSSAVVVYAQSDSCPAEAEIILSTIPDDCAALGRNQVCYGSHRVDAELDNTERSFSQKGDLIPVNTLISLRTYPLSSEVDEWGIAVFKVQAKLPDTLPGENVTLIVFGDVEIMPDTDAPEDYQEPMQAFYLRTGIGEPACRTIPEGGVLVQTPQQYTVNLMINGFEVRVGSTALLTAADTDELTISTLEGNVQVTLDGVQQDIPAGFSLTINRDAPPEIAVPDPEAEILLVELLPEPVPQVGEPSGEIVGLLSCAASGGVDVVAGSDIILRGGWADYDLSDVRAFAATTPPTLSYNGQALPYSYREGPSPWTGQDGDGFVINWFWIIPNIDPGAHEAAWAVGGETIACEIRAG